MLIEILKARGLELSFTILEIGAAPTDKEPFHQLLRNYPSSRVIAFEVDPTRCAALNATAPPGLRYYAQALGRATETRDFFETTWPNSSSLYPPNQEYCDLFQNLGELTQVRKKSSISTVGLDDFINHQQLPSPDFIKIDVQGAELEILESGAEALKTVLATVCEVEFEPIYTNQPLYEDVTRFLRSQGFSFHKFLWLGGRVMKPILINNDPNDAIQHMWSDALYFRGPLTLDALNDEQLLKYAVLMELYGSMDVALYALSRYDRRKQSDLSKTYLDRITRAN